MESLSDKKNVNSIRKTLGKMSFPGLDYSTSSLLGEEQEFDIYGSSDCHLSKKDIFLAVFNRQY